MSSGLVEMRRISKFFSSNGVKALESSDFTMRAGEIHAVLGENGAGKSTLMQILSGIMRQDSGEILIDGKVRDFYCVKDALKCGIGMVRQRPELTTGLRVWEDCILGAVDTGLFSFYGKKSKERVRRLAFEESIDLDINSLTDNLSVREKQMAGILTLLLRGAKFLIFDEPTAVLNASDSEMLFLLWRKLSREGHGIVIISHKLEETLAVADRFTVLRQGKNVFDAKECNAEKLLSVMFGESNGDAVVRTEKKATQKIILDVQNISVEDSNHPYLRNVSFSVNSGEILGVAGIKESGSETLELALAGFLPVKGKIKIDGKDTAFKKNFREAGGAYLSAGRHKITYDKYIVSSDMRLSIKDNMLIHSYKKLAGFFGVFNKTKVKKFLNAAKEESNLHTTFKARAGTLSGGMLQRLLGVREFMNAPKIIIMSEPIWGLDRQRRDRFYNFLRLKAKEGCAIVLFFSDIDELISISDKIIVLRNGECVLSESSNADMLRSKINSAMIKADKYAN